MTVSKGRLWPIEDFGLYEACENVCNALCDNCCATYTEDDTGVCCCPTDFDYMSPHCLKVSAADEVHDYFLYQVLPFCKEKVRGYY